MPVFLFLSFRFLASTPAALKPGRKKPILPTEGTDPVVTPALDHIYTKAVIDLSEGPVTVEYPHLFIRVQVRTPEDLEMVYPIQDAITLTGVSKTLTIDNYITHTIETHDVYPQNKEILVSMVDFSEEDYLRVSKNDLYNAYNTEPDEDGNITVTFSAEDPNDGTFWMPVNAGEPYYFVIRYYKPDVNNLPKKPC